MTENWEIYCHKKDPNILGTTDNLKRGGRGLDTYSTEHASS
jgi:hypothetical protein